MQHGDAKKYVLRHRSRENAETENKELLVVTDFVHLGQEKIDPCCAFAGKAGNYKKYRFHKTYKNQTQSLKPLVGARLLRKEVTTTNVTICCPIVFHQ